ncbi:hypothetical protein [Ramlibacter sp. PS4R-6]|uniref:hypothetical protein n=1 Tax=Ramlibacter sp. PS4R-6 TaxID=3133438 RepID=UPI00309AC6CB
MDKRFFIAWLVVFIAWFLGSFVVHGVLLHGDYARLPNLFRPEADAQKYFPLMLLAHVFLAGALTWIYSRGAEAKPWVAQGVRFGIAVAFLTTIPTYTIYYVVQPMPADTVVKQIIFDSAVMVFVSLVAAFMYRTKPAAA